MSTFVSERDQLTVGSPSAQAQIRSTMNRLYRYLENNAVSDVEAMRLNTNSNTGLEALRAAVSALGNRVSIVSQDAGVRIDGTHASVSDDLLVVAGATTKSRRQIRFTATLVESNGEWLFDDMLTSEVPAISFEELSAPTVLTTW